MSRTLAHRIAEYAQSFDVARAPAEVVEAAKLHLLDALGVGLAAASLPGMAAWADAVASLGSGATSTALGRNTPLPAAGAALLNGSYIHSLEYDDTHTASIVHGSSVIAPAALAVAEEQRASGATLLGAFIVGWELFARMGLAAPGRFQAEGFQITAVGGPFIACTIASMLRGCDEATAVNALGIAGSQASGVFEFLSEGATVKSLHPGWAAHGGIVAATLAAGGMTGPTTIFEGRFGLYRTFARDDAAPERLARLLDDLGSIWHLPEAGLKAYACCHYIHPFLEALIVLVERARGASSIVELVCHVPVEEAPLIAEPWSAKQHPKSGYDAKWGLPYCLGALLVDGKVELETFSGEVRAEIVQRASRMSWVPWSDSGFPDRFPARVEARLSSGKVLSHEVRDVAGGSTRPFGADMVVAKFNANAARRLTPAAVGAVVDEILTLEKKQDLARLASALRSVRR
ncbi:MAG: MmgE/PrpD family protein [Alphaproteobacteria bacterium]